MSATEWARENKCNSEPGQLNGNFNCFCEDGSICKQINGNKTGCPCEGEGIYKESNTEIWKYFAAIGGGIVGLVLIYLIYRWWGSRGTKVTTFDTFITGNKGLAESTPGATYLSQKSTKAAKILGYEWNPVNKDWVPKY